MMDIFWILRIIVQFLSHRPQNPFLHGQSFLNGLLDDLIQSRIFWNLYT